MLLKLQKLQFIHQICKNLKLNYRSKRNEIETIFLYLQAKLLENSAWLGASPSNIAGKFTLFIVLIEHKSG